MSSNDLQLFFMLFIAMILTVIVTIIVELRNRKLKIKAAITD